MLIGFVAPKQSGKTTACQILKEYWGTENVAQVNFKDGLIAELKEKFPDLLREICFSNGPLRVVDDLWVPDIEQAFIQKPPLIRALLQNYGTEVRRGDHPDYWVDRWEETAEENYTKHILCDDVRFHNEAEAVKKQNSILIRITRTDLQSTDTHQSETEQASIQCDHEIVLGHGEQDRLKEELIKIVKLYE